MGWFIPPPPTRYDLRFSIAGIPVRVHPVFWVVALLFGLAAGDLLALLIWVLAVFVSILVHELGHALVMRWYGQPASIVLYHGGGLTIPEQVGWGGRGANLSLGPDREIVISLAGPVTGFLFTALIIAGAVAVGGRAGTAPLFGFLPFPIVQFSLRLGVLSDIVSTLIWINIFWGLINLLPVFPLDGGQMSRNLLFKLDPLNGVNRSLRISLITGIVIALLGLVLFGSLYMALLFGLLAFQSYLMLRGRSGGWSG